MTKVYRFIMRMYIEDETYLPGVFVPKELDIKELLEAGAIAEYKHGKKKKLPVSKRVAGNIKEVTNGDR